MDWKTLRRDKLAKTAPYSPRRWQDSWWWRGVSATLADLWARFEAFPGWEKGMVLGSLVLIAVIVPVALFTLGGGGSAAAPPATATRPSGVAAHPTDTPTHTPTNTPTSTFTPIPTKTPKPEPIREDCDEIRGTAYQSDEEREWFIENCLNPTPDGGPTSAPPGVVPTVPPPGPGPGPAPSPTPRLTMTAAQAAGVGEDWILSEPTLSELDLVPGSCSAQASGDHWVVSCRASTTGCVGACEFTIRICVSESPLSVWQC